MATNQNFKVLLEMVVKDRTQAAQNAAKNIKKVKESMDGATASARQLSLWTQKRTGQEIARMGKTVAGALVDMALAAGQFSSSTERLGFFFESDEKNSLQQLNKNLLDMGSILPVSQLELANTAIMLKRAGVQAQFLQSALFDTVVTAKAFNMTESATGEFLTIVGEQLGVQADRYKNLASAIRTAASEFPVSEQAVLKTLSRSAFALSSAGFAPGAAASLAAAGVLSGLKPERLASSLKDMIDSLKRADNLGGLARVLGLNSRELEKHLNEEGGIAEVLKQLFKDFASKKPVQFSRDLRTLGISAKTTTSLMEAFSKILSKTDNDVTRLEDIMNRSNQAFNDGTRVLEDFELLMKKLPQQVDLARDSFNALIIELGGFFEPQAKALVAGIILAIEKFKNLDKQTKETIVFWTAFAAIGSIVAGVLIASIAATALFIISLKEVKNALVDVFMTTSTYITRGLRILRIQHRKAGREAMVDFAGSLQNVSKVQLKRIAVTLMDILTLGTWRLFVTKATAATYNWRDANKAAIKSMQVFRGAILKTILPLAFFFIKLAVIIGVLKVVMDTLGITWSDVLGVMTTTIKITFNIIRGIVVSLINVFIGLINTVIIAGNILKSVLTLGIATPTKTFDFVPLVSKPEAEDTVSETATKEEFGKFSLGDFYKSSFADVFTREEGADDFKLVDLLESKLSEIIENQKQGGSQEITIENNIPQNGGGGTGAEERKVKQTTKHVSLPGHSINLGEGRFAIRAVSEPSINPYEG